MMTMSGCGILGHSISNKDGEKFAVKLFDTIPHEQLPSSSSLQMVDGDIARFAAELCDIDHDSPDRCDVYASSGAVGVIQGYLVLKTSGEVTMLDSSANCGLAGPLFTDSSNRTRISLIGTDFEAHVPYAAWERGPGDVLLIGSDDPWNNPRSEALLGSWFITTRGDKLRLTQDKWNYCDRASSIDEVFLRVVSLQRSGAKTVSSGER